MPLRVPKWGPGRPEEPSAASIVLAIATAAGDGGSTIDKLRATAVTRWTPV